MTKLNYEKDRRLLNSARAELRKYHKRIKKLHEIPAPLASRFADAERKTVGSEKYRIVLSIKRQFQVYGKITPRQYRFIYAMSCVGLDRKPSET